MAVVLVARVTLFDSSDSTTAPELSIASTKRVVPTAEFTGTVTDSVRVTEAPTASVLVVVKTATAALGVSRLPTLVSVRPVPGSKYTVSFHGSFVIEAAPEFVTEYVSETLCPGLAEPGAAKRPGFKSGRCGRVNVSRALPRLFSSSNSGTDAVASACTIKK